MWGLTQIEIGTAIVFVVLQIVDFWTATQALKYGVVEQNKVAAWMIDRIGKAWPLVKLCATVGGAYLLWREGIIGGVWLICAVSMIVALTNWKAVQELKGR